MKLLDKVLIGLVLGGVKKKKTSRDSVIGFERKKAIIPNFVNCGNFTTSSGTLESEHPYQPLTACRWHVEAAPGVRLLVRIVKMDIEEEDPTDSPMCNERAGDHLPSCINSGLEAKSCEWDYLQIKTDANEQSEKMCKYVEKDAEYTMQPDGKDFDYYFDEYTYDTAYDVQSNSWYSGRKLDTNAFTVEFATDALASFYGFKLEWETWDINPCEQGDKCGQHGRCLHETFNQYTCACSSGYELDTTSTNGPSCTKLEQRTFTGPDTKDLLIVPESKATSANDNGGGGSGNWYVALEQKFQEKLKIMLNPTTVSSKSKKRPHLVSHLYERVKNAISKSFFGVVRRCDVTQERQTNGVKFRSTLLELKRAKNLNELLELFDVFLAEKYDQPRCRARQAKLSGKTGRFLRWALRETTVMA